MKGIILAAGLGTRIKLDTPKPMYEVNGKPLLEHNVLLLKKYDVKDIFINLHYKGKIIKDYFKDGSKWGVKIHYSYEKQLLGTSGAVKNVEKFWDREPFFVIYGDNYTNINLKEMLKSHGIEKSFVTIALYDPRKSLNSSIAGSVVTLDGNNNIISFIEGGGGGDLINGYVNAGVYVLDPKVLDMIPSNRPSDFGKDIFPMLLKEKLKLKGYLTSSFVLAIDTPEALRTTKDTLVKEKILNDNN